MQEMETIGTDILTRLGLSEPLGSIEPLTVDEKAIVAAFRDYTRLLRKKGENMLRKILVRNQLPSTHLLDNCKHKVFYICCNNRLKTKDFHCPFGQ